MEHTPGAVDSRVVDAAQRDVLSGVVKCAHEWHAFYGATCVRELPFAVDDIFGVGWGK